MAFRRGCHIAGPATPLAGPAGAAWWHNSFRGGADGGTICEMEVFTHGEQVVSATFVTPYSPGFPGLVPGQCFTDEILEFVSSLDTPEVLRIPGRARLPRLRQQGPTPHRPNRPTQPRSSPAPGRLAVMAVPGGNAPSRPPLRRAQRPYCLHSWHPDTSASEPVNTEGGTDVRPDR
jgi:hypothetical protein